MRNWPISSNSITELHLLNASGNLPLLPHSYPLYPTTSTQGNQSSSALCMIWELDGCSLLFNTKSFQETYERQVVMFRKILNGYRSQWLRWEDRGSLRFPTDSSSQFTVVKGPSLEPCITSLQSHENSKVDMRNQACCSFFSWSLYYFFKWLALWHFKGMF